jgi:NAD(P)-dependent dehydrogenase (short-subunit alcohol dehydrogenase family)
VGVLVGELRRSGATAVPLVADVRDESQVRAAVEDAADELGGIDVLYNNAGVLLRDDAPVHALERETWDEVLLTNTTSVYLFCRYAVPHLLRAESSVILNVASVAATAGDVTCHAYSASKSALIGLTASIAQRYGPDGLRAVLLCPGFVITPMIEALTDDLEASAQVVMHTALRRLGEPEELASVAAFLASTDASFVTSTIVSVHGGLV